jgi:adenosyl cobinamide kinase/adenosyl cobinamide phosphate guanylyltransferase
LFLALLTLLTSLVISGVAIYYSVSGLAAIFAAAALPIIIMGTSLEVGKLVTALWLHRNWKTAPFVLKSYLMLATVVLMFITSIGIFGFLSRAHIEQTAGIGTVATQIEQLNLDIQLEQDKINNNKVIISQLDTAVNNLLSGSATQSQQKRTGNAQQASKLAAQATKLREQQNEERTRLQNEITAASNQIADLNRKKLEFEQKIKNIETEVGPIKYIAQFVYGADAGSNKDLLEKSITWLILVIIFVFDPLAVLLLIASQISWTEALARRHEKKLNNIQKKTDLVTQDKNKELDKPVVSTPLSEDAKVSSYPNSVDTQITDAITTKNSTETVEPQQETVVESKTETVVEPLPKKEKTTPKKKESYMMKDGNNQVLKPKKSQ